MIPWDDDIDVALTRDSYQTFIEHASEYLPKDYFIQNPHNCPQCPYPYTKLRKRGTKYIEYINRNIKIETGIYIDIYPVDRIPDDEKLRKRQFDKVRKWIMIYVIRQSRLYDKHASNLLGILKNFAKWVLCCVLKILPQKYCLNKIDYYITMYNKQDTQRFAALNSPNYNNIYINLYPLERGMFDGICVNLPGDYKTHLKMRYGDYSKDLPENERYGHVPYILDFGMVSKGEN
jgi:lipopolysaccharide cholinephosphotransferase